MNRKTEVFLFIDALGWETVCEHRFAEDLLPERRSVEMQFGYSCSAIPTILSGKTPAEHGHLGLFRFAPEESPFKLLGAAGKLLMRPRALWERGRVRNLLSLVVGRLYGFTGYFRLYHMPMSRIGMMDYCEKRDLFVPGGMEDIENLADVLKRSRISSEISDWRRRDGENLRIAADGIASGTDFLFIYTADLDAFLHGHCRDRVGIGEKLAWYEERIGRLFRAAERGKRELRLTVFSDHGMTPLAGVADVKSAVERTGLVFGRDYGACYDSTMFRAFWLTPHARGVVRRALEPFSSRGHWLTADEEKRYGIHRPDRLFGDEIFLMDPGIQIVPSDLGVRPLNGMHGFAPEDPRSRAAILSNSPIPEFVRGVADYFPLMLRRIAELEARS